MTDTDKLIADARECLNDPRLYSHFSKIDLIENLCDAVAELADSVRDEQHIVRMLTNEIKNLQGQNEKFKDQVHWTHQRAVNAETERDAIYASESVRHEYKGTNDPFWVTCAPATHEAFKERPDLYVVRELIVKPTRGDV